MSAFQLESANTYLRFGTSEEAVPQAPSTTAVSASGAATAADVVPVQDMFWVDEPGTLNELEEMYDIVAT